MHYRTVTEQLPACCLIAIRLCFAHQLARARGLSQPCAVGALLSAVQRVVAHHIAVAVALRAVSFRAIDAERGALNDIDCGGARALGGGRSGNRCARARLERRHAARSEYHAGGKD